MSVESERDRVFFPNILRIMTSQVVYILEKCNKLERFTERPEVIVLLPVKIIRLVQMKSNEVLVYAAPVIMTADCVVQKESVKFIGVFKNKTQM